MLRNTHDEYGSVSRTLHWLAFVFVVGMLAGGRLLAVLPDGSIRSIVVGAHKSVGVLVFLLTAVRLLWRLANPRPRSLGSRPVLRYVSEILHVCLYVLLLIQPLAGILMSQAYGYPVVVFGWIEMPALIWYSPLLGGVFRQVHSATAAILLVFIVVHSAAALKHHWIDGDRTLIRMLKGG
jgi:cytochrome b561